MCEKSSKILKCLFAVKKQLLSSLELGRNPLLEQQHSLDVLLLPRVDEKTIMSNMDVKEIGWKGVDWIHLSVWGVQWLV
jgi:hypothetical protein